MLIMPSTYEDAQDRLGVSSTKNSMRRALGARTSAALRAAVAAALPTVRAAGASRALELAGLPVAAATAGCEARRGLRRAAVAAGRLRGQRCRCQWSVCRMKGGLFTALQPLEDAPAGTATASVPKHPPETHSQLRPSNTSTCRRHWFEGCPACLACGRPQAHITPRV